MSSAAETAPGGAEAPPPPRAVFGLREAGAGMAAGLTGTLLGYPLDRVKQAMQSGSGSMTASVRTLWSSGSVYRGAGAPLFAQTMLNTTSFAAYAFTRNVVGLPESGSAAAQSDEWWRVAAAGALVTLPVTLVSTPAELCKLQQQVQPQYRQGTLHAARSIWSRHGLFGAGLYRGTVVNAWREALFLGCYFSCYETMRRELQGAGLMGPALATAVSGGCSGAAAWLLSFPLDTLKTVVQAAPLDAPRRGSLGLLRELVATRGVLGLYRGVGPTLMRAFIVSSSRFSAYELAMHALKEAGI